MTNPEQAPYDPQALAMPREFFFQNGLRVITLSTPTKKTSRMSISFKSGSRDDPPGHEGIAHFLEHLMFAGSLLNRGSPAMPAKTSIMQKFRKWGGGVNASTNNTETSFFFQSDGQSVLNTNLADAADVLLDIVQHPRIKEEEVDRERRVIKTELATDDDPAGTLMHAAFYQSAYPNGGLGHPIIGTPESLDRTTSKDLRKFWHDHYIPSNATICIQGQETDEELLKIVTDRLTVLGASHREHYAPDHPPMDFTPGDVRVPFDQTGKLSYHFLWQAGTMDEKPNTKEVRVIQALQNILHVQLGIKIRDHERLTYGSACFPDPVTDALNIRFESEQPPEKLIGSFAEFMANIDHYLTEQALQDYKDGLAVQYIKFAEDPRNMAFRNLEKVAEGEPVYRLDAFAKLTSDITIEEVREMATRIFGKPFAMAVVGKPELLEQVPTKAEIEETMNLLPNDKPVAGAFAFELEPYDPCHGETEPRRNPIHHRQSIAM